MFTKEDLTNIPKTVPVYTDLGNSRDFDLNFDVNDVVEVLDKLMVDKAIGPDWLSPKVAERNQRHHQLPVVLVVQEISQ